mgnify:CR=1 FL=1
MQYEKYESEDALGFTAQVELEDVTAQVKMITAVSYNTATPYFFIEECSKRLFQDNQTQMKIEKAFLEDVVNTDSEIVTDDVKAWASNVLENAQKLIDSMEFSKYKNFSFSLNEDELEIIRITPCTYSDEPAFENVEYFLTDDNVVPSGKSIYQLASNIQNYEENTKCIKQSRIDLQQFYREKVMPIEELSFKEMTEEQRDVMEEFSSRHEAVYGCKPHRSNECAKIEASKPVKKKDDYER